MSANRHGTHARPPIVVGADVGATWIRVVALRDGRPVLRRAAPVSAVREVGKFLLTLWKRRGWRAPDVAALAVATRGVWTRGEITAQERRLRRLARRVIVLSDAQAALLGALGGRPGVLILAGTGSIVLGRNRRGRWERAGGLGPLLGDEGSAFWIAREWLRATTRGEDFAPVRRLVTSGDAVSRIASLAPAVVRRARRGDRRARAIVRAAQAHLAAQAADVARRLSLPQPVAMSWAGSVLANTWFRTGLQHAVARTGLQAKWIVPEVEPVMGAARLAARLAPRS